MEGNNNESPTVENKPQAPIEEKSAATTTPVTPLIKKRKKRVKKFCWLCRWGHLHIDYKDTHLLQRYLRNNKIVTHKITGNCLKHQHQVTTAIKRARMVALLPFVGD